MAAIGGIVKTIGSGRRVREGTQDPEPSSGNKVGCYGAVADRCRQGGRRQSSAQRGYSSEDNGEQSVRQPWASWLKVEGR